MRATIERKQRTADGGGGHTTTWRPVVDEIPAFAWIAGMGGGFIRNEGGQPAVVDARRVILPLGSDVLVGDRITVATRRGVLRFSGLIVDSLGPSGDHLLLVCRAIG